MVCPCIKNAPSTAAPSSRKRAYDVNQDITILISTKCQSQKNAAKMQVWANVSTKYVDVKTLLDGLVVSKRKSAKMFELYCQEASVRGHNKFSLYSAFTNYASYADERNGFNLKNNGNDTQAISMWTREQEVSKWVSDPKFIFIGG